jgi:hypothetical protein
MSGNPFKRVLKSIADTFSPDQRVKFHDLAPLRPEERKPRSRVLQFYSAVDNIGNFTPVLGIQDLLGFAPDTWDCHTPVDWDLVHRHYSAIIIGGAGLLHGAFTRFWQEVADHSKLPMVVWGVGGCFPTSERARREPVAPGIAKLVFERCAHINLRDAETASYYGLRNCHVSMCPTVFWLRRFRQSAPRRSRQVLLAEHIDLVPPEEVAQRKQLLETWGARVAWTDNVQRPSFGLQRIITELYCSSRLVVATRLHGAIIAHGLNIPYVVRAYDRKLDAFVKEWSGGAIAGSDPELKSWVDGSAVLPPPFKEKDEQLIEQFGGRICEWLRWLGVESGTGHGSACRCCH